MTTSLVRAMFALDMESMPRRRPSGGPQPNRRTPFVGREQELSLLAEHLDAAGRGEGGVVLIAGEPGCGKTRLLTEFGKFATSAGWLVLNGRAYDTEGMPPYLPFVEALKQCMGAAANDDVLGQLVQSAPDIALLIPDEDHRRFPALATELAIGPETERYRLFESVSGFLLGVASTSESRGLLLCLDDLHWADRSTLLLFQHLARKLGGVRLLVVATFRTVEVNQAHPLSGVLANLTRERRQQTITLASLSLEECASLIGQLGAGPADPAVVQAIYERTEGNPFFVEEVVRQIQAEGRDLADGRGFVATDWGIPEGVRQVIGQRLSRLRPATREALQTAAVLGNAFSFDLLAEASEMDSPLLTDAVERRSKEASSGPKVMATLSRMPSSGRRYTTR